MVRAPFPGSAWLAAAALASTCLAAAAPAGAEERVDLELVLAVDVSGSMDRDEQELQRAGYVAAIRSPEVLAAIEGGLGGRIALAYVEWAGTDRQRVVVPWTLIDGAAAAEGFATRLAAAPVGTMRGTSISGGLTAAAQLFPGNGYVGLRRVVDISGDGPNNMGPPVAATRDQVLGLGIVVNGLPIALKSGAGGTDGSRGLAGYYARCVIGGPGAFVVEVTGREQFADAIRRKLVLEIADAGGGADLVFAEPLRDTGYSCGR
ncbi:DUF1194 domain-containing protein [Oharaeibacter diazotrophicus]|uniref:Uncharacterized protein DUF1194 n=1 Tax=Oharaeibacter diazotrophicus TaxID=1920512 RepID=A0A4R6RJF9_9HYPH|nr:DUF1194 domain-containing protein [Oharaeibacter diazotrophicus]TDP86699.1 uncharacterized protein DUF1194 [Oharaeibacter diazotrophicus]BBE71359.1 hypothetical protein OHA_1_00932 [Pleomorphomonas sp. SM30]GLS78114.1 hypothetical protein GCM10007904_34510 [Oharaeibacter diazotrophicus]